jgi:NitT/TauT family transport system substrate-binding protein
MTRISRRRMNLLLAAPAIVAGAGPAFALDRVNVGFANSATDIGLFVAHKRGYFAQEGVEANFVSFDSAARMIAPFASGDLDVGGGGPSAGLYNAIARGIDIRIVADKSSTPPGRPGQYLLVRKDLIESGRYKSLADLKGMKIAGTAPGGSATTTLYKLLELAKLRIADVERIYLGFPQQAVALQNKAIDAALPSEPSATIAVEKGAAVKVMGDDEMYPYHQIAVILYGGRFAKERPQVAQRFMRAYLRAVRDYNDSLDGAKFKGPEGDAMIAVLTEFGPIKDASIYRKIGMHACNPDGTLNVPSLAEDLEIFRKEGLIEGKPTIEQALDVSFRDAAVKELGPYVRKR